MLQSFFSLVGQNKSEAVFLNAVALGYIYAEADHLILCSVATKIPDLGLPRATFLLLAVLSLLPSSYIYTHNRPNRPENAEDMPWSALAAAVFHLTFIVVCFVELLIRVCTDDLVVIGLFLAYPTILLISYWSGN